jgi:DNA-binding transcriptional MerR regulator
MRIGELAQRVGVSTDTVRFYERSGWLPRASRLLIDLRRLDLPLGDAGRIASWCHSGHCAETTTELPRLLAERRAEVAERISGLQALDARLAGLERHLTGPRRSLAVVSAGPCCEAADAVIGSSEGGCACCSPSAAATN